VELEAAYMAEAASLGPGYRGRKKLGADEGARLRAGAAGMPSGRPVLPGKRVVAAAQPVVKSERPSGKKIVRRTGDATASAAEPATWDDERPGKRMIKPTARLQGPEHRFGKRIVRGDGTPPLNTIAPPPPTEADAPRPGRKVIPDLRPAAPLADGSRGKRVVLPDSPPPDYSRPAGKRMVRPLVEPDSAGALITMSAQP
jgi:hypothetical protein